MLFVGPDVEAFAGDLGDLVATLDSHPEIALAGVRQVDGEGALWPSIRRFPSARHMLAEAIGIDRAPGMKRFLGEYELDARKYERMTACEWTSGLLLVRSAALDDAGWFDERLRYFAAEADLCLRLRREGGEVVHIPSLTARRSKKPQGENLRLEAEAAYARMQFARKHFPCASADYRWALALRYALHLGAHSLRRYGSDRRQASRNALATVLRGKPPLEGALRH
jgi:GT2 family glycosyltransferase